MAKNQTKNLTCNLNIESIQFAGLVCSYHWPPVTCCLIFCVHWVGVELRRMLDVADALLIHVKVLGSRLG